MMSGTLTPASFPPGDDFYVLSSGLTTLETTIGNGNPQLWANVTAQGELYEWIRWETSSRINA